MSTDYLETFGFLMPEDDSVRDSSISKVQEAWNTHFSYESAKNYRFLANYFVIYSSKTMNTLYRYRSIDCKSLSYTDIIQDIDHAQFCFLISCRCTGKFYTIRPRGYKKNKSCSTQLSMKCFLLINVKMPTKVGILTFIIRINSILGFF